MSGLFFLKKNQKESPFAAHHMRVVHKVAIFFPIFMLFSTWCMLKMQPCLPKKLSGAWRRSPRDGAACGNQNLDVLWAPQLWLISLRIMVAVDWSWFHISYIGFLPWMRAVGDLSLRAVRGIFHCGLCVGSFTNMVKIWEIILTATVQHFSRKLKKEWIFENPFWKTCKRN